MRHPVELLCRFNLTLNIDLPEKVVVYSDPTKEQIATLLASRDTEHNCHRVLWLIEPEVILGLAKFAVQNQDLFTYIITHDEHVLRNCKNARMLAHGTSWIKKFGFPEKSFCITTLVGKKMSAEGHLMRNELWPRQFEINNPIRFYIGRFGGVDDINHNPVLWGIKNPMFDVEFHIAIENCKRDYYFTEKVMDCFTTKTIPIYWGCPSIADFFNTKGMFIVRDVQDIIDVCNSLTSQTYSEMSEYVEENFERAHAHLQWGTRIEEKLQELFEKEPVSAGPRDVS